MSTDLLLTIKAQMRNGEYVMAYDTCEKALASGCMDLTVKYLDVLSLARCGATGRAAVRYADLGLERLADTVTDTNLARDIASLRARLLKDRAYESGHRGDLERAARAYEDACRKYRGSYPAVNAATLWLLSGDTRRAKEMAAEALDCLQDEEGSGAADYWSCVTEAEARLLVDASPDVRDLLRCAAGLAGKDWTAIASTRRQLGKIVDHLGLDDAILQGLSLPSVVHYTGQAIGQRVEQASESAVASAIARQLALANVGWGAGSLGAGTDILFAEALLARGAHVCVVLPFCVSDFIDVAVAPFGGNWVRRFETCLAQASEVLFATSDRYLGDKALFAYASRQAMGLALLKANALATQVCQMAVGHAGDTGSNLAAMPEVIIALPLECWPSPADEPVDEGSRAPAHGRMLRAILFGDIKGFSKLTESQLPVFADAVLRPLAEAIDRHGSAVIYRNTWGDGLFLVVESSVVAARLAISLQQAMNRIALDKLDLPATLGLRLGGHFGPVFSLHDPITKTSNYFGEHVSRTARIEPITPEGQVYVTESFAADVMTACADDFSLEYVGKIPAAKGYGDLRMYSLNGREK